MPTVQAAVYGLPEPPTPAPTPEYWFNFSDDFLGVAVYDTDDYRTGNMSVGGRVDAWRFGFDFSILTNRGEDGSRVSRSDEITGSLGYAVIDRERAPQGPRTLLTIGAGLRAHGDFSGESIQNDIHDTFGYPIVHLPYDTESGLTPFVFMHMRITDMPDKAYQLTGPFGRWLIQGEAGGLAGSTGEVQTFAGVNLVSVGRDSLTWIGTRYQWHGGDLPTHTAEVVAEQENGWWVVVGIARTPGILVTASYNPRSETVAGTLGLAIDHDQPVRVGPGYTVDTSLKFFPHSGNLGLDVRWQPSWQRGCSCSERDTLVLSYDFGAVPDYDWRDNKVHVDQLVLGWGPNFSPLSDDKRLVWNMGAYAAMGVRLERVLNDGANPRFNDDGITVAGVAQAQIGTRFGYRFTDDTEHWYNQLRLGIGIDGWLPFQKKEIVNGADRAEHMRPGYAAHITIGMTVDW